VKSVVENSHYTLSVGGLLKMPNDADAHSAPSIALEGIGKITFCLRGALAEVMDESATNQETSQTQIPDSPNSCLIESVLDSFRHAVLDAKMDAQETLGDLQASLVGSTTCHNRIGNYWRVVGNNEVVLKQGHLLLRVPEAISVDVKGFPQSTCARLSLSAHSFHILAYGDR